MFSLKAIKFRFKGSYDKQSLTLVVISYEISETRRRLVSKISFEMISRERSSMFGGIENKPLLILPFLL